ncbi:MAG: DNA recombination protein RmuC [Jatrophihabitans sp.]|uniref:DNA recombination protein RmuC n=1 Tax=Jatrophihabitans sp. TaxID=1932789 RepID=UPI003F7F8A7E
MELIALVFAVLMLVAGLGAGWTLARRQAAVELEAAGRRATADLEIALRQAEAAARADRAAVADELAEARVELAELRTALEHEQRQTDRTEALLRRNETQLKELFGAQAAEVLQRNAEQVVQLAQAQLAKATTQAGGDLAKRQEAIEHLVAPLRESLGKVHEQLEAVERGRTTSESALREQLRMMGESSAQLKLETAALVTALRAPQTRGRWGEMQLERVVEAAGMTEHVDFVTQETRTSDDGAKQRPDLVVRLTGGKTIVVDAKVPFAAYLEAMEARDERTRDERMKAHARHLRTHIDGLAGKRYPDLFECTPEFVVCFVPADAFLDAALREDATLQEHAFARNVVLATPSTLIALLRTISYSWRQEALATNARHVHELGRDLYKRLCTLGNHFDKLGRSLKNSVESYNSAVGSMERMVLSKARQMNDLGVVDAGTELPRLEPLDATPRPTTAPELAAAPPGRPGQTRVISLPQPELPTGT